WQWKAVYDDNLIGIYPVIHGFSDVLPSRSHNITARFAQFAKHWFVRTNCEEKKKVLNFLFGLQAYV
ncbi:hypothetical protein RDI91_10595, partial [Streptococcus ruminantium]